MHGPASQTRATSPVGVHPQQELPGGQISPKVPRGELGEKHSTAAGLQELGLSAGVTLGAVSPSLERKLARLTAGLVLKSE